MEDRIITYTVIKEIHRFTLKLVKGIENNWGTEHITEGEKKLLRESIEKLVKVSMFLETKWN
jgi:hypothetical protein